LIEGKPASGAVTGKRVPVCEWHGAVDRGTWVLAAPIDCSGVVRRELAVAATAGELCLLKTRDLVYNLIGDKWNTGESSPRSKLCLRHCNIHLRCTGLTTNSKLTYIETVKQQNAAAASLYVGPAQAFLSHTWGDCFCDTVEALLPTHDQCYRAMVEPRVTCSASSLLRTVLHACLVLCVPFLGWLVLPIMGSRKRVLEHMSSPRWWTPRAVVELADATFWIDIFCKNQHVVNSGDTAVELSSCVKRCGRTVLACSPWHDPTCLRRIWCQFEVHHTFLAGTTLDVRYPDAEKRSMDSHMYSWRSVFEWLGRCDRGSSSKSGSQLLGEAIASLEVTNARATVATDREMILLQITKEYGGQGDDLKSGDNVAAFGAFDSIIRKCTIDGIVSALGGNAGDGSVAKVGERRPRQVPWAYRVAMYSFTVQLLATVIICVVHKLLPLYVLPFLASVVAAVLACMFINMAAKTTNLLQLLQNDPRSKVLRRERHFCLFASIFGWGATAVGVYFGLQATMS
jgi:hypothetical protein